MAEEPNWKVGEIVRRNRRTARIQRFGKGSIHIRILKDLGFRVYESEVIDGEQAPRLLRRLPQGHYSCVLFDDPDRIEAICRSEPVELMRLVLGEHTTPFGKREFKQILVLDDGVVPEDGWNAFWNNAYREMRAHDAFRVDEKGRYSLA